MRNEVWVYVPGIDRSDTALPIHFIRVFDTLEAAMGTCTAWDKVDENTYRYHYCADDPAERSVIVRRTVRKKW